MIIENALFLLRMSHALGVVLDTPKQKVFTGPRLDAFETLSDCLLIMSRSMSSSSHRIDDENCKTNNLETNYGGGVPSMGSVTPKFLQKMEIRIL